MIVKKQIEFAGKPLSIEIGRIAAQADGAAWVRYGDNITIATVVAAKEAVENADFFPLSVDYREKMYAAGKIPGGFFKREGRPSEKEILAARMVDRPIRPLFPKNFFFETQVMTSVLSADGETNIDFLAAIAASAAICVSDIPFDGPIASTRVCLIDGSYVLNPSTKDASSYQMELVVSGTEDSVIMVEGEAKEINEKQMIDGIYYAHNAIKPLIQMQKELMEECGKPKRPPVEIEVPDGLEKLVKDKAEAKIKDLADVHEKVARREGLSIVMDDVVTNLDEEIQEFAPLAIEMVNDLFRTQVRQRILKNHLRPDGRKLDEIRPITCEVSLLPRVHGSAMFTRGQTQALASVTLGTKIDEQRVDNLAGDYTEPFMLHYNFPPFSVGEIKRFLGTSRREVGHGNLAGRAIKAILPPWEEFPYTIRVVSDIMESNGSSSMASVCAGSLALMDAGVPVKKSIAGIAMGLISEDDQTVILSDILGEEDHLGDMDFKVTGTREGITACQMDIKIKGISPEIMERALMQARAGRMHILGIMDQTMSEPRPELSPTAPRIIYLKVDVDKIGAIIGPGGKMIRDIIDKTGASIDIDDDGTVCIASINGESGERAKEIVLSLVMPPEVGKVYHGIVKKIMDFGAFVEILPGKEGLLHISQIDRNRVDKVSDHLKVGDQIDVKLMKIDAQGRLDLSHKVLLEPNGKHK
jgi:polyribonucleotide nucleotidyltransferase